MFFAERYRDAVRTVHSYKYDGWLHCQGDLLVIEESGVRGIYYGPPGHQLLHHTRCGIQTFPNESIEFYFGDRWYTAACTLNEFGKPFSWYINIAQPCSFFNNGVWYVDMDLDIRINNRSELRVVDRDEFNEHANLYGYPEDLINSSEFGLKDALDDIRGRRFPFGNDVEKCLQKAHEMYPQIYEEMLKERNL